MKGQPASPLADPVMLSGWLFADLLLALAVIFMVSAPGQPAASAATPGIRVTLLATAPSTSTSTSTPTSTSTSTSTPMPMPTSTPAVVVAETVAPQASIAHQPVELTIQTNADALLAGQAAELARVKGAIQAAAREAGLEGRAGIVLTFGTSPSPGEGSQLAARVNQLLAEALPAVFEGAAVRTFHQINAAPEKRGEVLLEVYVVIGP
jgi:hypothetical protein